MSIFCFHAGCCLLFEAQFGFNATLATTSGSFTFRFAGQPMTWHWVIEVKNWLGRASYCSKGCHHLIEDSLYAIRVPTSKKATVWGCGGVHHGFDLPTMHNLPSMQEAAWWLKQMAMSKLPFCVYTHVSMAWRYNLAWQSLIASPSMGTKWTY